jgi:alpha-glucosidase
MPFLRICQLLSFVFAAVLLAPAQDAGQNRWQVASPNGQIVFVLSSGSSGSGPATLRYSVDFHSKRLLDEGELGLDLQGLPALGPGMHFVGSKPGSADETYTIPVGKSKEVRDHYNSLVADFAGESGSRLSVEVRAFDDGLAFRYVVPEQPSITSVHISAERTQFRYSKDATLYPLVVSGFQSSYEDDYQMRTVGSLHHDWLVALPLLAEVPGTGWVAITEANIDNYAGMYLRSDKPLFSLKAELSPKVDVPGVAVDATAPFHSPWRVLMIGDAPGRLIESNIILNLNPPSKIADTSWIQAGKSAWDWWSGDWATGVDFTPGMNTATLKHYIEFASDSGFPYMLIDAGWALSTPGAKFGDYADPADITRYNPNVDLPELLRYAKEKNVRIWLWSHWTSVDKYMDQAFPLFEKWGVAGVKIDFMNRDDQWMVDWYHRVVEKAAEHHLMIDYHGAFKPDGLRRTYPNLMTREGVMGKEYSKWSARVTPVHNTTLPFTRMLAGPMDYTPGAFNNTNLENFIGRNKMPMSLGTRAQELALYVVFESPLEMVSDYPEQYKGQKAFDFIKQVPATWDEVRVIDGLPMRYITLARRSGKDWYVGSLTNWEERNSKVPLDFLGEGKYVAEIYADAPDAASNATHITFSKRPVDRTTVLDVRMVSGGGNAIWIHPAGAKRDSPQSLTAK